MSKKSTYILWILLTIIIGCFLSWWLCCNSSINDDNSNKNNSLDNSEVNAATSLKEATKNPFSIEDSQTGFSLTSNNNFNFNLSNASFSKPIASELDSNIDKLKAYLQKNPNKTLDIVGQYKNDETNSTSFDNLGISRANSIKQYLISKGIPENKISTNGILNNEMYPDKNSILYGPVTFSLLGNNSIKEEETKDDKTSLKANIFSNPLIVNFESAKFNYIISEVEKKKIANIVNYINNTEGSSLSIIGHTDNSGLAINNKKLGQRRADFIKGILVKNGAPSNKIKTFSKGEEVPIATNENEEGKRKNRRIEYNLN